MNEAETRAELIDPALREAGWGVVEGSRVRREAIITNGRILGKGMREPRDIADYVLFYKGKQLAVIEAKRRDLPDTEGVGQAKKYAKTLQARFAYSTNGAGIYQIDMQTGEEKYVDCYLSQEQLWAMTFAETNEWRDRFGKIPFETKSGTWQVRYYQHNAIDKALEAIAAGKKRVLLTLATGTGKTAIAFQIAWKLFHSRWNLSGKPTRLPRILFLADRNILANQAKNAFSAFPDDALTRISPEEIRRKGRVPKNASLFFTIFQTFMTGADEEGNPAPYFGEYPSDFFDFIVIDECHRGGANDESSWRAIMEHFTSAVQLGLTATPKRIDNIDTYSYFGDPVYIYSLKEGINDGFLTPFRLKKVSTTLDEYVYTPDDDVIEGDIDESKRYTEKDFNRLIVIEEREKYRVETFMKEIDQSEKTIVFCATQDHALAVRNLINQMKSSRDPEYCVRVTANDGALGEQHLRTFQDNEKTIPTILTTSQKLSTGVDARNIRNIVLMRPIKQIIEFKQIIGRGTRLFDGKDYFTLYDFVEAYEHFNDPDWDGEPQEPEPDIPTPPKPKPDYPDTPSPEPPSGTKKIKVKLADGKVRHIQHMIDTKFYSPTGKPISVKAFMEQLFGTLPNLFKNEEELRKIWGNPKTRKKLLEGLQEKGFGLAQLEELRKIVEADKCDLFDVLVFIAYAQNPITRQDRVAFRKNLIFALYQDKQQEFLDFVLHQYIEQGVGELDEEKLPQLLELKYHAIPDAVNELGSVVSIRNLFVGFQEHLYSKETVA